MKSSASDEVVLRIGRTGSRPPNRPLRESGLRTPRMYGPRLDLGRPRLNEEAGPGLSGIPTIDQETSQSIEPNALNCACFF